MVRRRADAEPRPALGVSAMMNAGRSDEPRSRADLRKCPAIKCRFSEQKCRYSEAPSDGTALRTIRRGVVMQSRSPSHSSSLNYNAYEQMSRLAVKASDVLFFLLGKSAKWATLRTDDNCVRRLARACGPALRHRSHCLRMRCDGLRIPHRARAEIAQDSRSTRHVAPSVGRGIRDVGALHRAAGERNRQ